MDVALVVSVVVALISAIAGILAAVSAHRSADTIDRRNHRIAALDDDRATLEAAFTTFMSAVAATDPNDTSKLRVAADVLCAHPRATPELEREVRAVAANLSPAAPLSGSRRGMGSFTHTHFVGKFVRDINITIAAERADAVADLKRPWWRPRRA